MLESFHSANTPSPTTARDRPSRVPFLTSVMLAAALGSPGAWALGLGPVRAQAYLGQPLDATIVVQLAAGETLTDRCVSAAVTAGETVVPADQVTTTFVAPPGFEARIRVRTWVAVDEPVVTVQVTAGCERAVTRQFTVFVDPPPTAVALEPAAPARSPDLPAMPAVEGRPPPPEARAAAGGVAPPPRPSGRRSAGAVQRPAEPAAEAPAVATVDRSRAQAVAAAPTVQAPSETKAERAQAQRSSTGAVARGEGVPQLKLDSAVVASASGEAALARATQQKEEAMATAKIAVDAAEAANAAAAQRVADVETQLTQARKELAEAKQAFERMRAEQEAKASSLPDPYTIALAAACGVLLVIAGLLFMRLRRTDEERLQAWLKDPSRFSRHSEFDTVAPVTQQFADFPRTVSPGVVPPVAPPAPVATPPAIAPVRAAAHQDGAAPTRFGETQASSGDELEPVPQPQDISIEELLDVEQQAEFFLVLGQDDAAVDLLNSHVMSSGGASPLPYLKLLEIFRRIDDPASYERTRKRFNARFNGVAPEWGADPNAGRSLDGYADVMRRLERVWPEPVDAMTELQTLLFRNDSNLLFDLPAYRDIMLLFTIARDLHDSSAKSSPVPVDVLLPLEPVPAEPADALAGPGNAGPAGEPAGQALPTLAAEVDAPRR
jgi:pilus assembly protein FimV